MAYAGVMAHAGFDLIEDTIKIMEDGNADRVQRDQYHHYEKPYIFFCVMLMLNRLFWIVKKYSMIRRQDFKKRD